MMDGALGGVTEVGPEDSIVSLREVVAPDTLVTFIFYFSF
jgi:hypothetical protein